MCDGRGGLLGLIDWGDAGWGDPTLDFATIPIELITTAIEGYGGADRLGDYPEARFVWDHLHNALDDAVDNPGADVPIDMYRRFLDTSLNYPCYYPGVCTSRL
jgi:aminoglycoside phosphotransferase (APT) family kinase protein